MFSTLSKPIFNTSFTFIVSSANAFNLDQSNILSFGKELRINQIDSNTARQQSLGLVHIEITYKPRAVTKCDLIPPASAQTDRQTDGEIG